MRNNPFIQGYIRAILFVETDAEGNPLDSTLTCEDFSEDATNCIYTDCVRFLRVAREHDLLKDEHLEYAGHDFWLTRNGHGSGFWDEEITYGVEAAKILTIMSQCFGSVNAIVNSETNEIELF